MGYETKLIIGMISRHMNYAPQIATIAEIKLGRSCFSDTFIDASDKLEINECICYEGGNEMVMDRYGSKLYVLSAEKVLATMKEATSDRMLSAAIALLQSLIEGFSKKEIVCVLFGY